MTDYVLRLHEDLRKGLDRLCWMHNEPALHVTDHFAELRAQVDYDAERLLSEVQSVKCEAEKAPKDSDVNETRLEFIRILEELEKRTGHQPKPQTPASEAYSSLEHRVNSFKDSSDSLDDLDESYAKLTREITDETNRVERLLLGEQTIIYWQSRKKDRLGSLVYFGDLFLNKLEIGCLRSREFSDLETCQHVASNCSFAVPYNLSKSKQVVEHLFDHDLGQVSKFCYIGKSEDQYMGYSAEGSSLERKFFSYQYNENKDNVSAFGAVGLDTSANLFEIYTSKRCILEIENLRLESLHVNLLPLPAARLTRLTLTGVHFESFNTHLLALCTSLVVVRLKVTFSKEVRFDLDFLRPLRKLTSLELSLPHLPLDLSMLAELTELRDLTLEGSSYVYAEKLLRLSKTALKQILSPPKLHSLKLSTFNIEAINRDILSSCNQREKCLRAEDIELPEEKWFHRLLRAICFEFNHCDIQTLNLKSFSCIEHLSELSLSGISIADLPRGVFQNLPSLKRLNLDKNLIRHISSGVFSKLETLKRLSMDNNSIESIEANSFAQLHNLETLSLRGCRLKSIDSEMFNGLQSLKELYLEKNLIERIEVVAEDDRRINVAKANLSDQEKELVKKHLFTDLTRSLWLFNLSGNKLQTLDLNCLSNLKCLHKLDVSSNKINELSGEIGRELLLKFNELVLTDNQLTTIDKRALPKTLTNLDLSKNRLKRLDDDFFAGFTKLRRINLSQNELIITITDATFASCRDFLRKIDLSQNESVRATDGAFTWMLNPGGIGYDLSEQYFSLRYCNTLRIRKLTSEVLQALKKINFDELTTCCLSNCSIKSLIRDPHWKNKPETSDETGHFNLSWLTKSWQLKELDLSNNLIETLDDPKLFSKNTAIAKINLSGNRLSRIHRDIFKGLSYGETIDLSSNALTNIDTGLFRHLEDLKHINLSSNRISFLNLARLFRMCPRLETLNVADNHLDDRSTAEPIDPRTCCSMKTLKLANNRLEKMEFIRDMILLEDLDLQGNTIESVMSNGENMLGRLNQLTHLNLSGNRIHSLRDEIFVHLRSKLDFLDLSGNPLDVQLDSVLLELI